MSICLEHVTVYADTSLKLPILRDIGFRLSQGSIVLIIGQTGSGKSTLIDVMAGLKQPHMGAVSFFDHPLWHKHRLNRTIATSIGVVFQYPEQQLFAGTVQKEFEYSLRPYGYTKEERIDRIDRGMRDIGLPREFLQASPLFLSGGQKRKVALASTIAADPIWLFLDEPTAGLDPSAISELLDGLRQWKQRTNGTLVIATHDFDTFFPFADEVLIMEGGKLLYQAGIDQLYKHPEWLQQAGVGLSGSMQAACALAGIGYAHIDPRYTESQMADAILANMRGCTTIHPRKGMRRQLDTQKPLVHSQIHAVSPDASARFREATNREREVQPNAKHRTESGKTNVHWMRQLDPRGKWLSYVLISIGIVMQLTWIGTCVAGIVALSMVFLSGLHFRMVWRMIRPFLYFMGVSLLVSGLQWDLGQAHESLKLTGFSFAQAAFSCLQLSRYLWIMILGIVFVQTTSQLKIKQGLKQSLSLLSAWHVPVEEFALAASFMLRFIPIISAELERFTRIARARGKSAQRQSGSLRLRDVPVVTIPFLLSVMKVAEGFSEAMEARGYKTVNNVRTTGIVLKMEKKDWIAIAVGIVIFTIILLANRM
ncbi:ATP-binding cassette domain-containing protein [Fodinisporobacter ferrooxydans]|uniref:ATP-binding cassette domain-containing protein n=1 Tax=Fodinisporobacter ferrooxydans TaxID=2901836 RepID=A0ABY4CI49_9BACL|nr:ATP-binding cassette domain-containing protein [Alicyclobacillaceae bacterium MYW30-H2]